MENIQRQFVEYNNFLNSKFSGLNPKDNLLNFIITLASSNPDSNIAAKAANDFSTTKLSFSTQQEILRVFGTFHYNKEVIDLKNILAYYISQDDGNLFNYNDIDNLCAQQFQKTSGLMMAFFSDQHVWDFLTLYKQSK